MKKKIFILIGIVLVAIIALFIVLFMKEPSLSDTSWRLDGWYISSVSLEENNITLNFDGKKISGSGGVNSYSASYDLGLNNKITIGAIQSTEMASAEPKINEMESNYFSILSTAKFYILKGKTLKLLDESNNEILIFVKK